MVFSSIEFIYFFLVPTLLVFFILRYLALEKAIIWWLIIASLLFYAWWSVYYLILLISSVIVNFYIHKLILKKQSRLFLTIGTVINLATLAYFKYADFLIANFNTIVGVEVPLLHVILPLAISFFTFQQISFLFDTYHQRIRACSFARYCLFVVFFPQLIAGPIVLQKHTIPQFTLTVFRKPLFMNLAIGSTLFAIGLFKKIVLADSMAPFANDVFNLANLGHSVPAEAAWLGVFAYTFQIYFDFSGYCDMALGLARMFSITLPINFNSPYQAKNIVDFWRRWHMTLSAFLRDYLYIPLGGSRYGKVRQYTALMLTMLLGGLWHGASWTFVFWGFLHGLYLAVNHGWSTLTKNTLFSEYIPAPVIQFTSHLITLLAVIFAWVFFRAESFSDALLIITGMLGQTQFYNAGVWAGVVNDTAMLWLKIIGLAFTVLILPNSIELTRHYRPVLKVKSILAKTTGISGVVKSYLLWRPSMSWSMVIGVMASISLFFLYQANNITEFIYFNF